MDTTRATQDLGSQPTAGRGTNPGPRPAVLATAAIFDPALGGSGGAKLPAEAASFARTQSKQSRALTGRSQGTTPAWAKELMGKNLTPARMVAEIFKRTLEQADEAGVLEAHALLTELGRDPSTSALINARLTRSIAQRLTTKRSRSKEDER